VPAVRVRAGSDAVGRRDDPVGRMVPALAAPALAVARAAPVAPPLPDAAVDPDLDVVATPEEQGEVLVEPPALGPGHEEHVLGM